jgi:hypothetical protein
MKQVCVAPGRARRRGEVSSRACDSIGSPPGWSRTSSTIRAVFDALANSDWGQADIPPQDKNDRFRSTLDKAEPSGTGFNAWS